MTRWDARLYGCQSCQDLCPFNRHAITGAETNIGVIGSTIALEDLLVSSGEQLSSRFKSTVLGMRWISCEAIQRNGLIAAGNLKAHTLLPLLRSFKKAESAVLQRTAKWAEERIEREPGG
jgi:epoxyqueuosine reductase QueG